MPSRQSLTKSRSGGWPTFTPPQNAAHAAHCGLVLHRRSYIRHQRESEAGEQATSHSRFTKSQKVCVEVRKLLRGLLRSRPRFSCARPSLPGRCASERSATSSHPTGKKLPASRLIYWYRFLWIIWRSGATLILAVPCPVARNAFKTTSYIRFSFNGDVRRTLLG